jgi:3-hydroxybutyrate dehydrogenase
MSLKGKVALITGSTSGIGLGIATVLAKTGAAIVLNGFGDAVEIEKVRRDMEETHGVKVAYIAADISRYDEVEAMVKTAEKEMGSVDILVNNAGIQFVSPAEDFPIEKWNQVLGINLSGVFYGIRAALPGMKSRGFGRIVNVASVHGLVASPNKAAYVAAKHGVVGLSKVIALETAKMNITCNAICPGWVLTPLVQKQIDDRAAKNGTTIEEEERELLSEKQPNLRFAQPEEIGGMVVYLCSDAARNVTGTALSIDGAWSAQ